MAGYVLSLIPPMLFDWTQVAANQAQITPVCRRLDLSSYEQAALQIRFHAVTANALDVLTVDVAADGYTPDDPGRDFGQVGTVLAATTFGPPAAPPTQGAFTVMALQNVGIFVGSGGLARVALTAVHGVAPGNTFQVLMSIDLAVKTAGNSPNLGSVRMPRVYYGYGIVSP